MAAKRYTATFKGSGAPTTQGRTNNSVFFYLDDASTDAAAVLAAQAIAPLMNGELVGVTSQIYAGDVVGPWPSLTDNGGSDRAQCLFRSTTRRTENMTLPFLKHTVEKAEIEAVFEAGGFDFLNSAGEPIGQLVNIRQTQIIE